MSPAPASWIEPLHALRTYLSWLPAKNRPPGRGDLVEATDTRGVRGCFHEVGIFLGFSSNRAHRVDEQVAFFFGLGFGRFNHHRAWYDQRKRRGVGVKTIIDQPFGDIHRIYAMFLLPRVAEDHFMHRR